MIKQPDFSYQPQLFALDELEMVDALGKTISPEEARRIADNAMSAFEQRVREIMLMNDGEREEKSVQIPTYYDTYLELVDGGWPRRVAAYIAWAASPRVGRWPETQDKLANLLGMTSDRQIAKWRKNNPAIMEKISELQAAPMLKHRADVIEALIRSAVDPDYKSHQDRKLFLEITGDYVPTSKLLANLKKSMPEGAQGLSTEELEKYAGFDETEE
jgi:hypothetical protein